MLSALGKYRRPRSIPEGWWTTQVSVTGFNPYYKMVTVRVEYPALNKLKHKIIIMWHESDRSQMQLTDRFQPLGFQNGPYFIMFCLTNKRTCTPAKTACHSPVACCATAGFNMEAIFIALLISSVNLLRTCNIVTMIFLRRFQCKGRMSAHTGVG